MARNSDMQKRREAKIKKAYNDLVKLNKFKSSYIFKELSNQFDLTERTLMCICFGGYDSNRKLRQQRASQLSLNL